LTRRRSVKKLPTAMTGLSSANVAMAGFTLRPRKIPKQAGAATVNQLKRKPAVGSLKAAGGRRVTGGGRKPERGGRLNVTVPLRRGGPSTGTSVREGRVTDSRTAPSCMTWPSSSTRRSGSR
jgi:hypothetical protein